MERSYAVYPNMCYNHSCCIINIDRMVFIMRKKLLTLLLIFSIFFTFFPTQNAYAGVNDTELNIYAMYLPGEEKGDSVLLESKEHYLVIDMGSSSHVTAIIKQLLAVGASDIDVMFSHLHKDHVGASSSNILAGLKQLEAANIHVNTLYLPDPSLAPYSLNNQRRYTRLQNYMISLPNSKIVYLTVGNHVTVGDADGEIIGPLNTYSFVPQKYAVTPGNTLTKSGASIYTYYENNCSLAAIFTCGTTRYFTAGDCMADEANYLLQKYGNNLHCDIMKLSHHGTGSGNTAEILAAIHPTYSFASNSKFTGLNDETNRWQTYGAATRATQYGMCYLPATQKKTMIYHIKNDEITLYKGTTVSSKNKVDKWISVYGEDGFNREFNMYYFEDGAPLTGVQYINNHYFYFDETGRMGYGQYSHQTGNYLGWRTYDDGRRFYRLSENEKYAYMAKGFTDIKGEKYYFRANGLQMINDKNEVVFKHLGSNYYALTPESTFLYDEWYDKVQTPSDSTDSDNTTDETDEEENVDTYYFDQSGKMARNCIKEIDGYFYLFSKDGTLILPEEDVECQLVTFKNKTYAMYEDGSLSTDQMEKIDGAKYYFDAHGVMQKSTMVKIGKYNYYFGKSGRLVRDRKIKWKGQKYYCKPSGVVKKIVKKKK